MFHKTAIKARQQWKYVACETTKLLFVSLDYHVICTIGWLHGCQLYTVYFTRSWLNQLFISLLRNQDMEYQCQLGLKRDMKNKVFYRYNFVIAYHTKYHTCFHFNDILIWSLKVWYFKRVALTSWWWAKYAYLNYFKQQAKRQHITFMNLSFGHATATVIEYASLVY